MELRPATKSDWEHGYCTAYCSTDGLWSIGCWPVMFGVRVVAWRKGSAGPSVDYCAGADPAFLVQLLETIAEIFRQRIPAGASEREVVALMPGWERRPINTDPCWQQLQALAGDPDEQAA